MLLLAVAFLAGILTVLAPCILPLLPVVIGSSAVRRSPATPYIVVGSLLVSIIAFTYLLKASAVFITVPPAVWTAVSGGILVLFGAAWALPGWWERMPGLARVSAAANRLVGAGYERRGFWGDVIVGAALGPVFSSCSPTYFVILASVLPASFALGTLYLVAYAAGLGLVLLLIAFLGQRFANRLAGIADPRSRFKRGIGVFFVVLGFLIVSGYEKNIESALLNNGYWDVTGIEHRLLERVQ